MDKMTMAVFDSMKARLEKLASEVKADYDARSSKLSQAWKLTKEALAV